MYQPNKSLLYLIKKILAVKEDCSKKRKVVAA